MTSSAPSQFKSNFRAPTFIVRHGHTIYHPVTGTPTGEVKALVAEFGIHSGEYTVEDPDTGLTNTFADIRGFFYDLDVDAAKKGWDDDEKEAVRARLLRLAEEWPEAVQVHEAPRIAAPWPTYDSTHHNKIPVLAGELGLVHETLAYERENKNRLSVIADLEKLIVVPEEELTAV